MTINLQKTLFSSNTNAFKNTGVFTTSVTLSGTLTAGQEKTFTSAVALNENQVFVFARAFYTEKAKGGAKSWQILPSFDVSAPTTPNGGLTAYLLAKVNGPVVTFIAGMKNPYSTTETISSLTIDIVYTTYTLAS